MSVREAFTVKGNEGQGVVEQIERSDIGRTKRKFSTCPVLTPARSATWFGICSPLGPRVEDLIDNGWPTLRGSVSVLIGGTYTARPMNVGGFCLRVAQDTAVGVHAMA